MRQIKIIKKEYFVARYIFFCISVMYLELVFHIAVYGRTGMGIIPILMFGAAAGTILFLMSSVFNRVLNLIIANVTLMALCIYYIVQLIYYRIFDTFLSLVSVGGAENAMNFKVVLYEKLGENVFYILLLMVPAAAFAVIELVAVRMGRLPLRRLLTGIFVSGMVWTFAILILPLFGRASYSAYDLFHNRYVFELSMEKLGVCVTTVKDGIMLCGGESAGAAAYYVMEDVDIDMQKWCGNTAGAALTIFYGDDGKKYVVYGEQTDDAIDFKQIYESTTDEAVKNLTAYISGVEPDMENNYTGLFEGYNVVFVTAESLSPYAISEECTPTLYMLMNEGFVYNNFYNPRWYHSTIDGEYVNCIGQYPCSSDWSFYKSADTYQPYALGNAMGELGYSCMAYHDFTFYYYNRSETHANMGYDFKAIDYGLELPYYTPYSDLDMMEAVCDDFINEDKFVAYFMTFSGHLPYNYEYNAMSLKNRTEAEEKNTDKGLSDEAVAYIASQMELDKALEYLIDRLEKAGRLDDTLFIIAPDHYPYGLTRDAYNELAGTDISSDHFELHHSCLGIWCSAMEDGSCQLADGSYLEGPVVSDKLCASVDILPTVLNMLGVHYDSRLLAGHDIMSESEELVIFADHSFITDKVKYNTSTGEITCIADEEDIPDGYIDDMITRVEDILYMSDEIIQTDYFDIVY